MTPTAVIFDCDGVLVDSEPLLFDMLQDDFARHGLPLTRHEIERDYLGGTLRGVWQAACRAGATLPESWVEDFYDRLYAKLAAGTPLVRGIEGVLDALDGAGIGYAVGSNGSRRKMQVTLGQHPEVMARFGGRLFSGQDMAAPKPAPDLFLHAAEALGVAPRACAVIDDSPTGCRAARAAGMACWGYAEHDDGARLAAEGARVFHDMAALPALLGLTVPSA